MTTHNYTTIEGQELEYQADAELQGLIDRLRGMLADPAATSDDMILAIYSPANPIMNKTVIPGRGAVTAEVLANPAYRVMTDLLFRKGCSDEDVAELAARHTMTPAEFAQRLGVHVSAVRQAIEADRLGAWRKGGRWFIDPQSLTTFGKEKGWRGPAPAREAGEAPRASTVPLEAHAGTIGDLTLHVRHAGVEAHAKGPRGQKVAELMIGPWRRVGVLTRRGDAARFFVLEPADDEDEIRLGELFVRGRFQVVEKVNATKKAEEAWKAFEPA